MMTANKPETALYRAPTFSLLLASRVELVHVDNICNTPPHPPPPCKLCVRVKYYIVHMYSMPYYTYGSTANFLVLEPTALTYINYIKRTAL